MDNLPLTQECEDRMNTQTLPEKPIAFLGVNGVEYPLINGINKIGRKKNTCNVCLDLESVSREHAVVVIRAADKITIMDINSRNKTMLGMTTLRPYISYPVCHGDILQFGDVVAVLRLFEPDDDDALPMTQDVIVPETPVAARNYCKNVTTVPETPDDVDRDDSCNTSREISRSSIQETDFLEPGKPVRRSKLKKPVTVNFNFEELKDTVSAKNQSIHELETQLPIGQGIDILNAETQLPSSTITSDTIDQEIDICNAVTQLPPGVICNDSINHEAEKNYNADTELPLMVTTNNIKEQNHDDSNSIRNEVMNEEKNKVSFDATDDFIESQSLLTNKEIQGAVKDPLICVEIETENFSRKILDNITNVSDDKKIDVEGAEDGDITDCEDDLFDESIKPNITNDKRIELSKRVENDAADILTQILNDDFNNETSPTNPSTNTINKNKNSNHCDDIAHQSTQIIGDSVDYEKKCEREPCENNKLIEWQPTQIIGEDLTRKKNIIEGQATQIICDNVPREKKKPIEGQPFQIIGDSLVRENEKYIEDQPTQIICYNVPRDKKKPFEGQPTQTIGDSLVGKNEKYIEDQPTQIICYNVPRDKKKPFEGQPTQTIGDSLVGKNEKYIEDQPTQIICYNVPRDKKKPFEGQPTQTIGDSLVGKNEKYIEDQPAQIICDNVPCEKKKRIEGQPTQIIGDFLIRENEKYIEDQSKQIICDNVPREKKKLIEGQPTQLIGDNLVRENKTYIEDQPTQILEEKEGTPLRTVHKALLKDKNIFFNLTNSDEENYYIATQEIVNDLNSPSKVLKPTHVQHSNNNTNKNNQEKNLDNPKKISTLSSPQVKTINTNNPSKINPLDVLSSTDPTIAAEHNYYLSTQAIVRDLNSPLNVSYSTLPLNDSNCNPMQNSIKNLNKKVSTEETQNEKQTCVAKSYESRHINKIANFHNDSDDLLSANAKGIELKSRQTKNDYNIVINNESVSKIDTNKANKSFAKIPIKTVKDISAETSILNENKLIEKSLKRSRGKREVISTEDLETISKRRSRPPAKRDMETSQNTHCKTDIKKVDTRQTRRTRANSKENTNKTPKDKEENSKGKKCIEEKRNTKTNSGEIEPALRRSGRQRTPTTKYKDHGINHIKSSDTRRSRRINANKKKGDESIVYNTSRDSPALRKRPVPEPNLGPSTKKTKNDTSLAMRASVNTRRKPIHRVLFTALSNDKIREKLENLGAVVVPDVESCTVVVTEQLRRTLKLMCAIGLGRPIVGHAWIQACCDQRHLVDPWQHLLRDSAGEKKLNFNLEQSLKAKRYFLKSYNVSCTPSVQPAPHELRVIVECSGGAWREGGERWLCVFAEADRALLPALLARGAVLMPRDAFLASVMRQRLDSLPTRP